jgi:hypothetical protein
VDRKDQSENEGEITYIGRRSQNEAQGERCYKERRRETDGRDQRILYLVLESHYYAFQNVFKKIHVNLKRISLCRT